jgi:hypothetical protein
MNWNSNRPVWIMGIWEFSKGFMRIKVPRMGMPTMKMVAAEKGILFILIKEIRIIMVMLMM